MSARLCCFSFSFALSLSRLRLRLCSVSVRTLSVIYYPLFPFCLSYRGTRTTDNLGLASSSQQEDRGSSLAQFLYKEVSVLSDISLCVFSYCLEEVSAREGLWGSAESWRRVSHICHSTQNRPNSANASLRRQQSRMRRLHWPIRQRARRELDSLSVSSTSVLPLAREIK